MIALSEARRLVLQHTPEPVGREEVPLARARGRVLAAEVRSDLDLPPFDKAMMDGFALRAADAPRPGAELPIVGESRAGAGFAGPVPPGAAVRILTGAPLPAGLDAVVMIERCELLPDGARVRLAEAPKAEQHIARRAVDLQVGARVAGPGTRLRAAEIASLATVGCTRVPVHPRVRVHLLATGDEIVPAEQEPGPDQIRDSNTPTLAAQLDEPGIEVHAFPRAGDDAEELRRRILEAFEGCDVLVLTGGVSMGEYDLVGKVLRELGVEPIFHKVAIKPGKPVWFGKRRDGARTQLVFGLPGNPVSTFVTLETLVKPALAKLGGATPRLELPRARYAPGFAIRANPREQFLPAVLEPSAEPPTIRPIEWISSADLVELARADAFLVVPAETVPEPGSWVAYLPF